MIFIKEKGNERHGSFKQRRLRILVAATCPIMTSYLTSWDDYVLRYIYQKVVEFVPVTTESFIV